MTQVKLLALSGSTRSGSYNQRLVDIAAGLARGAGAEVAAINLREFSLPIYDGDLEAAEFPEGAQRLRDLFVACDGFLIGAPEFNGSVSGALKNAIDWASRPRPGDAGPLPAFRGKVAGIMSASLSASGGLRGLLALRQILGTIQTLVVTEQALVPFAERAFDGAEMNDPMARRILPMLVDRVVALAGALKAAERR
jgi:chromate reductase, NAD(P)H dehydrogenase (quinone)